jgi:hypothetical protein
MITATVLCMSQRMTRKTRRCQQKTLGTGTEIYLGRLPISLWKDMARLTQFG